MPRLTAARSIGLHAAIAAGDTRSPLGPSDQIPGGDAAKLAETYGEVDETVELTYKQAFNSGSLYH